MTTESESRMREALENLIDAIEPILTDEQLEHRDPAHAACVQHFAPTVRARLNAAREALSPPARRTSTEWKVALWNAIDRWARARYEPGSKSVIAAEKAVVEVHNLIDATLANLTPPEEEA